jgi:dynein heavy chain
MYYTDPFCLLRQMKTLYTLTRLLFLSNVLQDGLLSFNMRELANMPDENPKWILLDGDLDANWIESMNSVMDDNRLLTLPSNERIRVLPHMKLIFEIRDLKFATPATATRAGILYISEGRQWHNMVQSWLDRVAKPYAEKAKWKVGRARTHQFGGCLHLGG